LVCRFRRGVPYLRGGGKRWKGLNAVRRFVQMEMVKKVVAAGRNRGEPEELTQNQQGQKTGPTARGGPSNLSATLRGEKAAFEMISKQIKSQGRVQRLTGVTSPQKRTPQPSARGTSGGEGL